MANSHEMGYDKSIKAVKRSSKQRTVTLMYPCDITWGCFEVCDDRGNAQRFDTLEEAEERIRELLLPTN